MKAKIRGTEIYFDVAGQQLELRGNHCVEKPVLFMLHGGPGGDHLRYKTHSLPLQDKAQLVFIDHRGCGRSKKTKASDYTLENNIEDIEALRKHLGLDKISILGTSYGGMVAQGYAIRYPKRVEKLILVVTAPSFRFIDEARNYISTKGSKEQIAICERLFNGTFTNHHQLAMYFKLMEPLYSLKSKKKGKAIFSKTPTEWSCQALNQGFGGFLRTFDYLPQLKRITCKTLILAGENDWICSPNQSKLLAKHIPHSKLHILKRCGHSLAVDAKRQYLKLIREFL